MNESIYRVQKNGIDIPNSATNDKTVALSHAHSIYTSDPECTVKVISSKVVENVVASYYPFQCRIRIGENFEKFESEFDLFKRISQLIDKRINFTLLF